MGNMNSNLLRSYPVHCADRHNSVINYLQREGGILIDKEATIGGTGSQQVNVLQVTGSVKVLNQWAEITRVGTLTNLTGAYAQVWDGSVAEDLTLDGAVLSGAPVGTFFTKDKDASEAYTIILADQGRFAEPASDKRLAQPFIVTQKSGVDTFIRFCYTTTDSPVDFDMHIWFEWCPINGGTLEFL